MFAGPSLSRGKVINAPTEMLSIYPTLLELRQLLDSCSQQATTSHSSAFKNLIINLLKECCDGMIKQQVIDSSDIKVHALMVSKR